jgi:hypothetical protein
MKEIFNFCHRINKTVVGMKKILVVVMTSLLLFSPAYALQQIAGPLVITTPIGGTGSARYGLINDGNETVTVSLRAEGDVEEYLSFPATADLPPGKIVYVDITAKIPEGYDPSLGDITGFIYAMQEGEPGMVKINVQLKKNVTIHVSGIAPTQEVEIPATTETTQQNVSQSITGLFVLTPVNSIIIILVVLAIATFVLVKIKKWR